jgi:hypothetical protein
MQVSLVRALVYADPQESKKFRWMITYWTPQGGREVEESRFAEQSFPSHDEAQRAMLADLTRLLRIV